MNILTRKYKTYGSPNKTPLVLIFGFGMSIEDWVEFGYVELLKAHFFIIVVEPFGFQVNGKDGTQSLTLATASVYIKEVLVELGKASVVVWGYSLGAKVALGFYGQHPATVQGLVLGGFELNSNIALNNDLVIDTLKKGNDAWLSLWRSMFQVPKGMSERLRMSDVTALIALRRAEAGWPDLTPIARTCGASSLVYAGERCFYRKQTEHVSQELPKGHFHEIPVLNHFELMAVPEAICDQVIATYANP